MTYFVIDPLNHTPLGGSLCRELDASRVIYTSQFSTHFDQLDNQNHLFIFDSEAINHPMVSNRLNYTFEGDLGHDDISEEMLLQVDCLARTAEQVDIFTVRSQLLHEQSTDLRREVDEIFPENKIA